MGALQDLLGKPLETRESKGYVFTAAEIAAQPEVWRKTFAAVHEAAPEVKRFLGSTDRILLTGAGSSSYAAASAVPLLRRSFRVAEAIPSTEILMDPESALPREEFALVSLARSGNSPEGNAVFELAERLRPGKVKQLVITCAREGELARLAVSGARNGFRLLLPEESSDRSLAMTSSFSSLAIASCGLAFLGTEEFRTAVEGLARAAENLLGQGSDVAAHLAGEGFRRVFFLGSRPFLGGVLEAHLKVQELSGGTVVAKAEDTLGFRHGPMAAVDANSLIILALSGDPCRRLYEADLLAEIREKRMGKKTVVIGDRASLSRSLASVVDEAFDHGPARDVTDDVRAPLVAIPGQLLGMFLSLAAGLRPDNPSPGGVINRVVQGVRIYPREA
ncbi:MAG TPA: sugar isomerase [Spirochaetia bacterium]|nr:sugar isomerase [Spirochaetia bacterium]